MTVSFVGVCIILSFLFVFTFFVVFWDDFFPLVDSCYGLWRRISLSFFLSLSQMSGDNSLAVQYIDTFLAIVSSRVDTYHLFFYPAEYLVVI